ncbi:MAG: hypothetical protein Q7K35_03805 [bacterium]|nr:hypothetical protein [bacterium]
MSKKSYKDPVFLFTSSSMRKAAYAGWYSALGDKDNAEGFIRQAYAEWAKEVGAGRKYNFLGRFNNDIYIKIDFDKLKKLTDKYLLDIKKEIRNAKK